MVIVMQEIQKVNYQKMLDETLAQLQKEGRVPTLLLHSCCAPCSSYVLEYLSQYFSITLLYYNPNISPAEEYRTRVEEQKRLIAELPAKHEIRFVEGNYEPERFYEMARGLEQVPEGGERCFRCYRLRLEEAARLAKKDGFDYFTTTLSISPLKNAQKLNEIGMELSECYGVPYLYSDFKKKNGYKRSTELSAEYHLYRQNFCGCVYSRLESERRAQEQEK
ncbi:MAG: epoxyqueuosine reductase QueH [Lachnospiraceae bacterium]|nr:epoxyqueuosine reductase QueH [Lachnospiraceae bacterium]